MAVKLRFEARGLEYAMVAPNDPEIEEFIGYREGMEFDSAGKCISAGTYVQGSNNSWFMQAAVGAVQIYVRRIQAGEVISGTGTPE